jgi:hypothetical protein
MDEIEHLLDNDEIVLITTKAKNIKFHKDFLYYLYTYNLCNKEYFKAHEENPSVGNANKYDYHDAFQDYVRLLKIAENLKELDHVESNVYNSIYKSIDNYFYSSNNQQPFLL